MDPNEISAVSKQQKLMFCMAAVAFGFVARLPPFQQLW